MPVPMIPIGGPSTSKEDHGSGQAFMVDVDALVSAIEGGVSNARQAAKQVVAEAGDEDAEILLDLWNRGKCVAEASSAEDKRYAVPEGFGNDKLMRLKAASLVNGDASVIRFTSKAVRVIKTIVLSEQNVFASGAVKKPYSVILAENKAKAATRSTLAFERTASAIVHEAQRNQPIESAYMPSRDTPYLESRRLTLREGTSNKHYVVRLFEVNGQYTVVAWNARNAPGVNMTLQPKGSFTSRARAQGVFEDLISSKLREGYSSNSEINNPSLLGVPQQTERPTERPAERPAPRTAPRATPGRQPTPRSTPPPEPTPAVAPPATPPVATPAKQPHIKPVTLPSESDVDADIERILSDIDGDPLEFNG